SSSAFEGHCDLLQFAWLFRQFRRNFSSGSARFLQFFWLSGENKTCTLIGPRGQRRSAIAPAEPILYEARIAADEAAAERIAHAVAATWVPPTLDVWGITLS